MDMLYWMRRASDTYGDLIKKMKRGGSAKVKCPVCGQDKMTISKSGYNGHLYIGCESCKCYIME